jgi:hypothetical protein
MIMGTAALLLASRVEADPRDKIHGDRRHRKLLQLGLHIKERRQVHKEQKEGLKNGGQKGFK